MEFTDYCWYAHETFKKVPLAVNDLQRKSVKHYFDEIADTFARAQKYFTPEKDDLYLRIVSNYTGINPLPNGTEKLLSQAARTHWRTRIGSQYSVRGLVVPIVWLATNQGLPVVQAYLESVEEAIAKVKAHRAKEKEQWRRETREDEVDKFTVAAVMWMRLEQQMSPPHKESLYRFPSSYTELVMKYAQDIYSRHDAPLLQMYLTIGSNNSLKAHEARTSLLAECKKSTQMLRENAVRTSQELTESEKVVQLEHLHRQRTVYG